MTANIGTADRVIRLLIATGITYLQYTNQIPGVWALVTLIFAFFLLATVVIGIDPFYSLFHQNTDSGHRHHPVH